MVISLAMYFLKRNSLLDTLLSPFMSMLRWPTTPDTFQEAALRMIPVAHQLSMRIMSMLERRGCKHLKPGTLEAAHSLWKDDSRSCLRVLNYPASKFCTHMLCYYHGKVYTKSLHTC